MTAKIAQIQLYAEEDHDKLESLVNKFLIERKLTRQDIIDIKICRSNGCKTVMIVYEVNYQDKS